MHLYESGEPRTRSETKVNVKCLSFRFKNVDTKTLIAKKDPAPTSSGSLSLLVSPWISLENYGMRRRHRSYHVHYRRAINHAAAVACILCMTLFLCKGGGLSGSTITKVLVEHHHYHHHRHYHQQQQQSRQAHKKSCRQRYLFPTVAIGW